MRARDFFAGFFRSHRENSGRGIRPGHEERSLLTAIEASKTRPVP